VKKETPEGVSFGGQDFYLHLLTRRYAVSYTTTNRILSQ